MKQKDFDSFTISGYVSTFSSGIVQIYFFLKAFPWTRVNPRKNHFLLVGKADWTGKVIRKTYGRQKVFDRRMLRITTGSNDWKIMKD